MKGFSAIFFRRIKSQVTCTKTWLKERCFHALCWVPRAFFMAQAVSARLSTKGSYYCIISITDNHKCLLLCLMKGGKTPDLEFQANFAIFVFWPHSLWPAFHFTLMLKDFLVQLAPSARHAVWSGPDLQQPYLQPATSSATTKETCTTSKQKWEKPTGMPNWSQTPQEPPGFPCLLHGAASCPHTSGSLLPASNSFLLYCQVQPGKSS